MFVGVAVFELHIEAAQSLKEKRMVVRSLRDRIRNRFGISVAEVALNDLHQRARIGLALVSNDSRHLQKQLDAIERFVDEESGGELAGWNQELINFGSEAHVGDPTEEESEGTL